MRWPHRSRAVAPSQLVTELVDLMTSKSSGAGVPSSFGVATFGAPDP